MARNNQYNPNQAGTDLLKFCETARRTLRANINPADSLESRIESLVAINRMDYNELRAALVARR